jgi:hypothetical protein
MGSPLLHPYDRLVSISILGKPFQIPENNVCLRGFQFLSPETISYGRYCWNQDCQYCRISYLIAGNPDRAPRSALACKLIAADGVEIVQLADELMSNLRAILNPTIPSHGA